LLYKLKSITPKKPLLPNIRPGNYLKKGDKAIVYDSQDHTIKKWLELTVTESLNGHIILRINGEDKLYNVNQPKILSIEDFNYLAKSGDEDFVDIWLSSAYKPIFNINIVEFKKALLEAKDPL